MSARYILRLDDACPNLRAEIWEPLEELLDELSIRPMVGVIPDNRDPTLLSSPKLADFWPRVRVWQSKGWDIALHGLHHVYHTISPDSRPILNMAQKSEYVGLGLEEQKRMLSVGYSIMAAEGVHPRIFMAPSHTFDKLTLQALQEATDIRCIADGHALQAFQSEGFYWVPQQLWRYKYMPFGLWCICLHPNTMSLSDLENVSKDLRRHSRKFIDVNTALQSARQRTPFDYMFSATYSVALKIKRGRKYV